MNNFKKNTVDEEGFSLLEVLVSLTILSIVLPLFLQIVSTGIIMVSKARQEYWAAAYAESIITELWNGLDINQSFYSGRIHKYGEWSIKLEPISIGDNRYNKGGMYKVTTDIYLRQNGVRKQYEFYTLRFLKN